MSDIGPPRKEPPSSELRIGAPPRPVTRLSRRTLVVATAIVTALVFAALWYALGIRPLRFRGRPGTLQYQRQAHRCARQYEGELRRSHSTQTNTFTPPAGAAARAAVARRSRTTDAAATNWDPDTGRRSGGGAAPARAGTSGPICRVVHRPGKAGRPCWGSSRSGRRWHFNAVVRGNRAANTCR